DWMFGAIVFDPNGLLDPSAVTLTPQSGGPSDWLAGYLGCPDPLPRPGTCWLINYIETGLLAGASMTPTEQTLAIVPATAGAPGTSSVDWSSWYGSELYFFGLTSSPGASLSVINTSFQVVPEPSTALLFGLGLIALGASRWCASRAR